MGCPRSINRYIPFSLFCFIWSSALVSTLTVENTGPSSGRNRTECWVNVDGSSAPSLSFDWIPCLSVPQLSVSQPNLQTGWICNCFQQITWWFAVKTTLFQSHNVTFFFQCELPFRISEWPTKVLLHSPLPLNPLPPPQWVRVNAVLRRVLGYHDTEVN